MEILPRMTYDPAGAESLETRERKMGFSFIGHQLWKRPFWREAPVDYMSSQKNMGRGQERWQRDIHTATGSFAGNVLNSNIDLSPLFIRLRKSTEKYLKKQGTITPTERDHRLTLLVRSSPQKPIAILACATALTRSALRSLLASESNVESSQDSTIVAHLRTIEAVSAVNPYAVDAAEVRKVQSLKRLLDRGRLDFLAHLQAYYAVEGAGTLEGLFPPGFIQQLLEGMCSNFRETLESFRTESDWVSAKSLISQLPALMDSSSQTFRMTIMKVLPTWRSWISWQPNNARISAWIRISRAQRIQLTEVLALDGPDFVFETHRTLFEAFMVKSREDGLSTVWHNRLTDQIRNVQGDIVQFVYRILQYLSNIRDSSIAIDIFIHFYHRSQIDVERIVFLERLNSTGKKLLFSSLYSILNSPEILTQVRDMTTMLETLNGSLDEELLQCFSLVFRDIAQSGIETLQRNLRLAFERGGDPHTIVHQLLRLRGSLEHTTILHQMLDPCTLDALQNLPTFADSDALLDLRRDVSKFSNEHVGLTLLDTYCKVRFTNQGTLEEESKLITEALVPIWRKPSHAQRKVLAASLMSWQAIPVRICCQCIQQVHEMEENYVRKLDAVVKAGARGAHMACLELITVLLSKGFQKKYDQACWTNLLLWMIEQQGKDLVQGTLHHMDMVSWMNWIEQLRSILNGKMDQSPAPILEAGLHRWSQRLKAQHSTAIEVLDRENIPGSLKQWIFLGEEEGHELVARMLASFGRDVDRCLVTLRNFIRWTKDNNLTNDRTWAAMAKLISDAPKPARQP
jgi:hypothetical protein